MLLVCDLSHGQGKSLELVLTGSSVCLRCTRRRDGKRECDGVWNCSDHSNRPDCTDCTDGDPKQHRVQNRRFCAHPGGRKPGWPGQEYPDSLLVVGYCFRRGTPCCSRTRIRRVRCGRGSGSHAPLKMRDDDTKGLDLSNVDGRSPEKVPLGRVTTLRTSHSRAGTRTKKPRRREGMTIGRK